MNGLAISFVVALAINISIAGIANADHCKMICTSKNAYKYILNTLLGERGRAKGQSTPIRNLGSCRHIKRGTIFTMERSLAKIVCIKSDRWKGCRYMGREFLTPAKDSARIGLRVTRGFKKIKGKNQFKYLGH